MIWSFVGFLVLVTVAGACSKQPDTPLHPLYGEWAVRMSVTSVQHPSDTFPPLNGVLVFNSALSLNLYTPARPPTGSVFGRTYVNFQTLEPRADKTDGGVFRDDLSEETYAVLDAANMAMIEVAPQIVGFDPIFRGKLSGDSITGTWVLLSHADTLWQGAFIMRRVPRSEFTDSAMVRARRAAQD